MLQNKEKSDTRRYHSPCQTSSSARVALQRCPILCMRKSSLSVTFDQHAVNVQSRRRNCPISPTRVSNHADSRCLTAPTYSSRYTLYQNRCPVMKEVTNFDTKCTRYRPFVKRCTWESRDINFFPEDNTAFRPLQQALHLFGKDLYHQQVLLLCYHRFVC